jgi:HK97 family phage portal protein
MGITLEEGLTQIVTSLILRGNAYLYQVEWDTNGPTCWRILHPDQIAVSWDDNGYRKYRVGGVDADAQNIDHISNFMLPNSLKGAGIIEYCRNSLGLGVALDDVAGEFFRNGIMSTGVIGVDAPLSPDEARAVADQFGQRHAGVRRAHLPIVMGGGAKYTPISLTPEDAQFIQSRQFQSGEIATLLGIPPHLLGIVDRTTSWGTGIEVQGRAFVDYTLRAYYKRIESFFTRYLRPGTYAEFVTDALTRADTATRYAGYHNALMDGWLNTDEVRLREGLPPLPNEAGQVYRTPASQIPASNGDGTIAAAPAAGLPSDNPNTGD